MSMVLTIQMFMLLAGALIIIFTQTNPSSIATNEVFHNAWLAEKLEFTHADGVEV